MRTNPMSLDNKLSLSRSSVDAYRNGGGDSICFQLYSPLYCPTVAGRIGEM